MKSSFTTFIFFFALALATTHCKAQVPISSFRLVQQWPAAFCDIHNNQPSQHKCIKHLLVTDNFTVHGLWPIDLAQRVVAPHGSSCLDSPYNGKSFNQHQITPIRTELEKIWRSFTGINSKGFWFHEWSQHGACSDHVLSQVNYFKQTIKLKNKHNIFKTLKANGIVPDDISYQAKKFRNTIINDIKLQPTLFCKSNGTTVLLVEITLCVNSIADAFINCTKNYVGCGGHNSYITYKSVSSLTP